MSLTLMSEFLTPDPPLCPETVYHRLLGCELRHQLCLLFLEQLKLQTRTSVLLQFFFQRMEMALGNKEITDQVPCYLQDRSASVREYPFICHCYPHECIILIFELDKKCMN